MTKQSNFFICIAWCYVILYCTCYISSNTLDNAIQLFLIILMIIFMMLAHHTIKIDRVGILLIFLIFTGAFPDFFYGMNKNIIWMACSYLMPIIAYICITNFYSEKKIPALFYKIPIFFGVIISAFSVINFTLRFTGIPIGSELKYVEKWDNIMEFSAYGLGCFAEWGSLTGRQLYRMQGYFIEPSKMAMFLITPLFFLLGLYQKHRKARALAGIIIILIAFLLTMSRAGMISVLGALILGSVIKRKKQKDIKKASTRDITRVICAGVSFIVIAIGFIYFLVFLSAFFPTVEFLSTGISFAGKANLIRQETVNGNFIIRHFLTNPFGSGFGSILELNKVTNLANALIFWITIGGFPAFVILLVLIGKLLTAYYIPSLNSTDIMQRSVAYAFAGLMIHSLSYGTWLTPDCIIIIAFMVVLQKNSVKEKSEKLQ